MRLSVSICATALLRASLASFAFLFASVCALSRNNCLCFIRVFNSFACPLNAVCSALIRSAILSILASHSFILLFAVSYSFSKASQSRSFGIITRVWSILGVISDKSLRSFFLRADNSRFISSIGLFDSLAIKPAISSSICAISSFVRSGTIIVNSSRPSCHGKEKKYKGFVSSLKSVSSKIPSTRF